MEHTLSAKDYAALTQEIRTDAAAAHQDIKDLFCKYWPDAKKAIGALLKIVTNPIAKLVLSVVEAIGDAAQGAICPK